MAQQSQITQNTTNAPTQGSAEKLKARTERKQRQTAIHREYEGSSTRANYNSKISASSATAAAGGAGAQGLLGTTPILPLLPTAGIGMGNAPAAWKSRAICATTDSPAAPTNDDPPDANEAREERSESAAARVEIDATAAAAPKADEPSTAPEAAAAAAARKARSCSC